MAGPPAVVPGPGTLCEQWEADAEELQILERDCKDLKLALKEIAQKEWCEWLVAGESLGRGRSFSEQVEKETEMRLQGSLGGVANRIVMPNHI